MTNASRSRPHDTRRSAALPRDAAATPRERLSATAIALSAWVGLGFQVAASLGHEPSLAAALWLMAKFFTNTTNLAVAVLFTGIAAGVSSFRTARKVAGLALAIMLVGIIYQLLLRGLMHPGAAGQVADFFEHDLVPIAVPVYWLAFSRKGALRWGDPLIWAVYPIAYLGYVQVRVQAGDRCPYPFLDIAALGGLQVLLNVVTISAGFLAVGYGIVLMDRRLARPADRAGSGLMAD
jgi:hypothetical protein